MTVARPRGLEQNPAYRPACGFCFRGLMTQRSAGPITMEKTCEYALSIKQPWAALIVHGIKSIEVRAWPTARRGLVYIHAARIADDRPHGWKLVPAHAKDMANLSGGLIGIAEVTDCVTYQNREEFVRDEELHRNDPT